LDDHKKELKLFQGTAGNVFTVALDKGSVVQIIMDSDGANREFSSPGPRTGNYNVSAVAV